MLGVDARGDELRAVLDHRGENTFSVQVHERHAAYVHNAAAVSVLTMRLFPIQFELCNPWPREPALQGPSLFLGLVGNRDSQHCSLRSQHGVAHGMPFSDSEITFSKIDGVTGDKTKRESGRRRCAGVPLPDSWQAADFMALETL
jgi:hypothetical protein